MIILGLTGSIGMGKTTTAEMLKFLGVPVHDSDQEVHALLRPGSDAYDEILVAFPYFSYPKIYDRKNKEGFRPLNRKALGKVVFGDDEEREKLEQILHPHVRKGQDEFIKHSQKQGRDIVGLDIPLLFETGADKRVHYVINVTAPFFIQQARVLARAGMDREKFQAILNRQMPDGEKNVRADFVVHTGLGRAHTMKQLKKILAILRMKPEHEEEEEQAQR